MKRLIFTVALVAVQCSFAGHTANQSPIKIAAVFAKTGKIMSSGLNHFQAVDFAVKRINKNGGILGRRLEVIEIDNKSSAVGSKLAAQKAVEKDVVGVIGASWSDHSIAAARVLQQAGIPMITPDSTNPKVTKIGDYIFRACFTDPFQGRALSQFAKNDLDVDNAVILRCITSSYSLGLTRAFKKHFKKNGGKVAAILDYKAERQKFKPILRKAKKYQPDIVFIPGHTESALIVKQAKEIGFDCPMLGGDGWWNKGFLARGGALLDEGYYTTYWSPEIDSPQSKEFVQAYGNENMFTGIRNAVMGYDAIMLMADAIKRAGSADPGKIRKALQATQDFVGVTGRFSFDKNGNSDKPVVIMEITDGKTSFHSLITPETVNE